MSETVKKWIKKTLIVVGILCLILLVLGIIVRCNDNIRFKLEYELLNNIPYENGRKIPVSIPWDNKIKFIKDKEVIETIKNKTGIVYFGYNSCPWCRNVIGILIEKAKENKIGPIYYVDIHSAIDNINEELITLLNEYLREDEETKEKVLGVPDVYFIKKGKIIGHHRGTVTSYKNPYKGMNDKQKEELKNIYQKLIEEMKK